MHQLHPPQRNLDEISLWLNQHIGFILITAISFSKSQYFSLMHLIVTMLDKFRRDMWNILRDAIISLTSSDNGNVKIRFHC